MPSKPNIGPLLIDSPQVRFAVIRPGNPYPDVILASDERYSDLVGYYSLQALGFEKLVSSRPSSAFDLPSLFLPVKKATGVITSLDVWEKPGEKERRELLYSLVVDSAIFESNGRQWDTDIIDRLKDQVRNIAIAYENGDLEKIKYMGQMLSTILSLLSARIDSSRLRRRYVVQMAVAMTVIYAAAVIWFVARRL
jgi:hypothetical protein